MYGYKWLQNGYKPIATLHADTPLAGLNLSLSLSINKIMCSSSLLISQIAIVLYFGYNELGFGTAKPKFVAAQTTVMGS